MVLFVHRLGRIVRFSVNPFLETDAEGANSYASSPAGEGLGIFFELAVELAGEVEQATGFVVNVVDIDRAVRQFVVPIFAERVREYFHRGRHIGFAEIRGLLKSAWVGLSDKFGGAKLSKLDLKLNPFRKVAVDSEECRMIYFSEKFEFAATHRLWNDDFSQERNFEVFGKCANPSGHGHNYVIEVTVKRPGEGEFFIGDFEKAVNESFVELVDHKNLNADVEYFGQAIASIENIAVFAWERLEGKCGGAQLHSVTIWETEKTYCTYCGQRADISEV